MSFLPLDDLAPTLTDVLAFIDDFDSDQTSLESSSLEKDPFLPSTDAATRLKKSRAAASRRFQQKKKAQLLALRVQVTALKKRLNELQVENGSKSGSNKRLDETQKQIVVTTWQRRAELEKHLRLLVEERNRQLKTVTKRQKQTAKVVAHLLHSVTDVVHIEEGLRTPHPMPASSGFGQFVPSLDDAIYSELASKMGKMYFDADAVFNVTRNSAQTKSTAESVEISWDPVSGVPYVELRSMLPVPLSIRETEDAVHKVKEHEMIQYKKHDVTDLGFKKEWQIELQNETMAMSVNVLSLARRYEEKNRVINTWASLVCDHPLDATVRFREQGWVLISESPSTGSVIQVCYRLSPDVEPGIRYSQENLEMQSMTTFVLQKLGSVVSKNFMDMRSVFQGSS